MRYVIYMYIVSFIAEHRLCVCHFSLSTAAVSAGMREALEAGGEGGSHIVPT